MDGELRIFDLSMNALRQSLHHDVCATTSMHRVIQQAGVTKTMWLPNGMLLSSCLDNKIRLWDARSGACARTWSGHEESIMDMDYAHGVIVTASEDQTVKGFRV